MQHDTRGWCFKCPVGQVWRRPGERLMKGTDRARSADGDAAPRTRSRNCVYFKATEIMRQLPSGCFFQWYVYVPFICMGMPLWSIV